MATPAGAAGPTCASDAGTGDRDVLVGTRARDRIAGKGGGDVIRGLAGSDCLRGGQRDDVLEGGIGPDNLGGGAGQDVIRARDGVRDLLRCGPGIDRAVVDRRDLVRGCERVGFHRVSSPAGGGADCALDLARLRAAGCGEVLRDGGTAGFRDAWGGIACEEASRHEVGVGGADPHPTASGVPQGNASYRRLTVRDGDDAWGERCELGRDDDDGPTAIYREGQRRITFVSLRLPSSYPLAVDNWQVVMQMKQTNPSDNSGGSPVLALDAQNGRWSLQHSRSATTCGAWSEELWNTPAQTGVWTRFAFDVVYSKDPSIGSVKVYVDLNGDGDAADSGEQSPTFRTFTLKQETSGCEPESGDGIAPGESIPSHLRTGIYHAPEIACPTGCSTELDNVQVVSPS